MPGLKTLAGQARGADNATEIVLHSYSALRLRRRADAIGAAGGLRGRFGDGGARLRGGDRYARRRHFNAQADAAATGPTGQDAVGNGRCRTLSHPSRNTRPHRRQSRRGHPRTGRHVRTGGHARTNQRLPLYQAAGIPGRPGSPDSLLPRHRRPKLGLRRHLPLAGRLFPSG